MTNKYINITTGFQFFQLFRFGFLLLVSIFLTRIFEDKTVIGYYEKLLLLATSLSFFWISGIFNSFIPVYRSVDPKDRALVMGQAFWGALPFVLLSTLGVLLLGSILYPEIPMDALLWFSGFTFLNGASYLLEYYFVVNDRKWGIMLYGFGYYALYFLAMVIPLYLGKGLEIAMQWLCVVGAGRLLLQTYLARRAVFRFDWRKDLFVTHFQVAWPLMLSLVLGGSAGYIDSYLVSGFFSNADFALFQYGAKELPIIALVANALGTVKSGEIASGLKNGDANLAFSELKKSSLRLIHLFFPTSVALLFFSQPLFIHVFNAGFADASLIFDIYLLLVIPRLIFPQAVLKGYLKTRFIMITAGIELVLNVGLSLIFMQFWGLTGIAAATVIAYLFDKILLAIYCQRKLSIGLSVYHPFGMWLLYSLMLALAYGLKVGGVFNCLG